MTPDRTTATRSEAPTWGLDALFPGGSSSAQFAEVRRSLTTDLGAAINWIEDRG